MMAIWFRARSVRSSRTLLADGHSALKRCGAAEVAEEIGREQRPSAYRPHELRVGQRANSTGFAECGPVHARDDAVDLLPQHDLLVLFVAGPRDVAKQESRRN